MRPSGLIPAIVLGLSALTAALPSPEPNPQGNRAQCSNPFNCKSGVCRYDSSSTTGFRCAGSGNRGDPCNPSYESACNSGLHCKTASGQPIGNCG